MDRCSGIVPKKIYRMGGKDIRPAMVVVAHGGPRRPSLRVRTAQQQRTAPRLQTVQPSKQSSFREEAVLNGR